jgi:putative peptide zinc metalloprotease protein
VPQNIAAAVNYACLDCVTYALATQLVVSLDGPLDADGQRELAAIWAELQQLAEAVPTMPLAELRDRLDEYEARIVDVVRAGGDPAATVQGAEATGTAAPGTSASGTAEPAEPTTAPATTEGGGTAASPADTGSAAGTSEPAATSSAPQTSAPATTAPPTTTPAPEPSTAAASTGP